MIVSVSGYGWTGSSAYLDLLREYDEISITHFVEFELLFIPGGILDLDYSLNVNTSKFYSSDCALNRFKRVIKQNENNNFPLYKFTNGKFCEIANKYFDKICIAKWDGIEPYDYYIYDENKIKFRYKILRRLEKLLNKNLGYKRPIYFSINPNDFINNTKIFFDELFNASGYEEGKIKLVNQLIPASNVTNCYKFFNDEIKTIIVMRDPRDVYVSYNYIYKGSTYAVPSDYKQFVEMYKCYYNQKENDKNILYVNFEDLVYNYEKTKEIIETFLGIKNHITKNKYFNPDVSIVNLQLFKKYPVKKEEISYIEEHLKNYLYDFTNKDYIKDTKLYNPPEE